MRVSSYVDRSKSSSYAARRTSGRLQPGSTVTGRTDARVLELSRRPSAAGPDFLGDRLEDAWRREVKVLALEVAEREAILRVLEDGPDEVR